MDTSRSGSASKLKQAVVRMKTMLLCVSRFHKVQGKGKGRGRGKGEGRGRDKGKGKDRGKVKNEAPPRITCTL